ncbi:hypothetical protein PI124_g5151 [Phytophthora idaei]|nr:hypothetical protein PI125_g5742 [Phytophthora idaei]KAG3250193.1 hypothetical protein PI124_g5151 [Phytophthora idaei]
MAHRLRVVHQERAVLKLLDNARSQALQDEGLDEAVVTIDFKLNAEPVRFCNNKVEHAWDAGMAQWCIFGLLSQKLQSLNRSFPSKSSTTITLPMPITVN